MKTKRGSRTNWKRQAFAAERLRFESVRNLQSKENPVRMDLLALGVAHEFNNILGAALGHAEWALDEATPAEMKEALNVIRTACYRCSQITKSLQGIVQPREEEKLILSLADLFQEIKKLWSTNLNKAHIEINFPRLSSRAYIDPGAFVEIFSNLIKNSIEAFDKVDSKIAKKIEIEAREEGSMVVIEYKDNGPGIAMSLRPYVFQPFFTTKGTLGAVYKEYSPDVEMPPLPKSSGLGLFLSKALAQEMGGDFKLLPEERQKTGVVFELSLPIVE